MDKYHQRTINLSKPRKGQEIIDIMQTMAKEEGLTYQTQINKGESRTLKVGFSSLYPYKHVAILTGDNLDRAELQPEAIYEKIAIGTEKWGGEVYLVGYNQEILERAVDKIAKGLETRCNL